ncbi:PREDICTED: juvenile hormone acid O-methyltransferase-like [Trachymyrmex cornetzi]|uniref:juvenile hormone acid O-methyltransferase-like n=1 Tax=Trachymyrmex cornetzi TaxID=471704 RepID=UPI00084F1D1C|nr:PREDICTED: juvenile hormone acid O-methyltransferase-like [Trachymyrmex cornetzi]
MASPKDYIAFNKFQRFNILIIIEEFAESLVKISGKCMDIGCGPGDTTKDFLLPSIDSYGQIIGTDISESMIKYANETFKDEKRLQFDVLNIETKNLPKKYISEFNHIFSFHTLQWCNDIRGRTTAGLIFTDRTIPSLAFTGRTTASLAFTGRTTASLTFTGRTTAGLADGDQNNPEVETMKNISPYQESKNPRKELKELLESIGFMVHHCSLRKASYSGKKSEHFANSILSFLTFLDDMPNDLMNDFKNVFRHEYMRRTINYKSIHNDEEHTLDLHKQLIVYAQKII